MSYGGRVLPMTTKSRPVGLLERWPEMLAHPRPIPEAFVVMRRWKSAHGAWRLTRRAVLALYIVTSLAVVVQRGILGPQHNVFRIFRQSFWHLLGGRNLYAAYPAEQGSAAGDLFKYSPTAALLFAPFAAPPYGFALF